MDTNLYNYDKCKKTYRIASKGIIANIEVSKKIYFSMIWRKSAESIENQILHEDPSMLLEKSMHSSFFQSYWWPNSKLVHCNDFDCTENQNQTKSVLKTSSVLTQGPVVETAISNQNIQYIFTTPEHLIEHIHKYCVHLYHHNLLHV